jgi:NitT/TauT family transport system substrate-binding protein
VNTAIHRFGLLAGIVLTALALAACDFVREQASGANSAQEVKELRIGRQIGLGYLPLYVMEDKKLIEKYAKQEGLGEISVSYKPLASPAVINDGILSGSLDVGSAGIIPFLTLWDKTKDSKQAVRMLSSISMEPLVLTTTRNDLRSIRDLTESDRIAVPAVKTSMNAMLLNMAYEKEVGPGKSQFVDTLEVPFSHADAVVAMLSGKATITAHMATMPFSNQELQHKEVHQVFSSYDVSGGPTTIMALWAREQFHKDNPKLMRAVYSALNEANNFIAQNHAEAAKIYIAIDRSKLSQAFIEEMLADPNVVYSMLPQKTMLFAGYLHEKGLAKHKPDSWKDLFFSDVHQLPGS